MEELHNLYSRLPVMDSNLFSSFVLSLMLAERSLMCSSLSMSILVGDWRSLMHYEDRLFSTSHVFVQLNLN